MARAQVRFVARDERGNLIQDAKVYVCEAGTAGISTPVADLYAAKVGGVPIGYLTTDASGEVVGYLDLFRNVRVVLNDNSNQAHWPWSAAGLSFPDKPYDPWPVEEDPDEEFAEDLITVWTNTAQTVSGPKDFTADNGLLYKGEPVGPTNALAPPSGTAATGDGIADDRSALTAELAAFQWLWLPPATYLTSKYVYVNAETLLTLMGRGGVVAYASNDATVVDDATTSSHEEARSGLLFKAGQAVTIDGVSFLGQDTNIAVDGSFQQGAAIYARTTEDLRVLWSMFEYGGAAVHQDANTGFTALTTPNDVGLRLIGNTMRRWRMPSVNPSPYSVIAFNRWHQPISETTWDRIGANGSSHAVYIFAGRRAVAHIGNIVRGARTNGLKVSGSSLPIYDVLSIGNIYDECGRAVEFGDDNPTMPFHVNGLFSLNTLKNPATGRTGHTDGTAFNILGSKNVRIADNLLYYDHDALTTVGSIDGISASRYQGTGSPVEQVAVVGNQFYGQIGAQTGRPARTVTATTVSGSPDLVVTSGTVTSDDYGLLLSGTGIPASTKAKVIVDSTHLTMTANATASGSITLTITPGATAPDKIVSKAINISDVGWDANAGHGIGRIAANLINSVGSIGVHVDGLISPVIENQIIANVITPMEVWNCRIPIIRNNHHIQGAATATTAQLRLKNNAFPVVYGNTGAGRFTAAGGFFGISDANGGSARVDHPLLGASGRAVPALGRPEVVMAYGDPAAWTDGDTVNIQNQILTYKGTAPGAGEFNTLAGLVTLINALAGYGTADYGADFADNVVTNHIRIRKTTATTSSFFVKVTCARFTAGMVLSNGTGANPLNCNSQGGEAAGPGTKLVIWSPLATYERTLTLTADNAAAAALLAANGYYVERNTDHHGSCYVVVIGAPVGTEVFRWAITP